MMQAKLFLARQPAYLRDIYRMYASMTHGSSMRDLCQRLNPQNLRINERRLVQFGLIEGLIRRIYKVCQLYYETLISLWKLFVF